MPVLETGFLEFIPSLRALARGLSFSTLDRVNSELPVALQRTSSSSTSMPVFGYA